MCHIIFLYLIITIRIRIKIRIICHAIVGYWKQKSLIKFYESKNIFYPKYYPNLSTISLLSEDGWLWLDWILTEILPEFMCFFYLIRIRIVMILWKSDYNSVKISSSDNNDFMMQKLFNNLIHTLTYTWYRKSCGLLSEDSSSAEL